MSGRGPWKGALVGFGEVAESAHLPAFAERPEFELVGVAEPDPERRAVATRLLPGVDVRADLEALLAEHPELDFVDVASPPRSHVDLVLTALHHGKHVLCEKPLAFAASDVLRLRSSAAERGRVLFPVHNWKHAPLLRALRRVLAGEEIGTVQHFEWHVLRKRPARIARDGVANWRTDPLIAGGGILVDHGWHAVYLACWLLGAHPVEAWGVLSGAADDAGGEEEATCLLAFPAATAVLHLSWRAAARGHFGVVYGTRGRVLVEDRALAVDVAGEPTRRIELEHALSAASTHPDWFADLLADFDAALHGGKSHLAALDEAESCARVLDAVYRPEGRAAFAGGDQELRPHRRDPESAKTPTGNPT